MTAWWVSTTRVRKVRARSSERFRTLAFGAALVSADTTEVEIVVMRAPWQVDLSDVAAGRGIQQGPIRARRTQLPVGRGGDLTPARLIRGGTSAIARS